MYIVQLCQEDKIIFQMLGCWAIALPSTEQIVYIYNVLSCNDKLSGLLAWCRTL